jgi:hypothetical protein
MTKYAQLIMGTAGTGKVRGSCGPLHPPCVRRRRELLYGAPSPLQPSLPPLLSPSPQSTYCRAIQEHCSAASRTVRVANLDPAAEHFGYQVRQAHNERLGSPF